MPRIPRLVVKGEEAVYHVISRTALDGFVLEDEDKEYLFKLIKWLSSVYFVDIFGFCIMGNHFHVLLRMLPQDRFNDAEVLLRARKYCAHLLVKKEVSEGEVVYYRDKFESLSGFVKEIKQRFSRYYNKKHDRRGYFWGERFKSVLIEEGAALLNCLAYIDLNPVRAGLVERPEDYRWCGIAYHVATQNKDGLLTEYFGLEDDHEDYLVKLRKYREYLYEKGGLKIDNKGSIAQEIIEGEKRRGFEIPGHEIFLRRVRYFSDGGILGSKLFVQTWYQRFKDYFRGKEKPPRRITGMTGLYSLKRLSKAVS